ncbi:16S rRNA (guanine(527)-N(7))-methyltransferase RsmG [Pseudacidovorax intermedius]|uniref:Ribosomal RNA small subunit methyltransferase G n=1 Tax=Pseudacidovorax intermedius TaxID=433924 RepID=A0A370FNA2_9BURK|nr:16S rRNA (guanine(527)-N(7))-methyltransferase RsmG [Pseudacidovorax intermedius]RDI29010.1 16S rRNA m(7)G-527 methyltransferase [Pseudacidovorax intermedius]
MSVVSQAKREQLEEGARTLGLDLTDAQIGQLLDYGSAILKWNKVYNLTALRDPALVITHHLLDSLAAIPALGRQQPGEGRLLDVGSGAGLPGVVIAICRPDLEVHCLDAVAKKMAFVQQMAGALRLPRLRGLHARVETLEGRYDVITSRAFASLVDFVDGSAQLLTPAGIWMAMKGKQPDEEIERLQASVDVFHVEQLIVPGLDAERCIVWMRKKQS